MSSSYYNPNAKNPVIRDGAGLRKFLQHFQHAVFKDTSVVPSVVPVVCAVMDETNKQFGGETIQTVVRIEAAHLAGKMIQATNGNVPAELQQSLEKAQESQFPQFALAARNASHYLTRLKKASANNQTTQHDINEGHCRPQANDTVDSWFTSQASVNQETPTQGYHQQPIQTDFRQAAHAAFVKIVNYTDNLVEKTGHSIHSAWHSAQGLFKKIRPSPTAACNNNPPTNNNNDAALTAQPQPNAVAKTITPVSRLWQPQVLDKNKSWLHGAAWAGVAAAAVSIVIPAGNVNAPEATINAPPVTAILVKRPTAFAQGSKDTIPKMVARAYKVAKKQGINIAVLPPQKAVAKQLNDITNRNLQLPKEGLHKNRVYVALGAKNIELGGKDFSMTIPVNMKAKHPSQQSGAVAALKL